MIRTTLLYLGGVLLVAGALLPFVSELSAYTAPVFAAGALLFGCMQMLDRYDGPSLVIRRLRRQQLLADVLLILTAGLLILEHFHRSPLNPGAWRFTLIVAVVFELYTAFRIPYEMEKEAQNGQ